MRNKWETRGGLYLVQPSNSNNRVILCPAGFERISGVDRTILLSYRGYAQFTLDGKTQLVHRYLMGCPSDLVVNHRNGDTLDNRLENLEIVSQSQNRVLAQRGKYQRRQPIPQKYAGYSCVYFLRVGDRVKIGATKDLKRRIQDIRRHHVPGVEPEVVCTVPTPPSEIFRTESQYRQTYRDYLVEGLDWYSLSILEEIEGC